MMLSQTLDRPLYSVTPSMRVCRTNERGSLTLTGAPPCSGGAAYLAKRVAEEHRRHTSTSLHAPNTAFPCWVERSSLKIAESDQMQMQRHSKLPIMITVKLCGLHCKQLLYWKQNDAR